MLSWFNYRLKVGHKFLVTALIILPFLVGLSLVGVWGAVQINNSVTSLYEEQLPSVFDTANTVTKVQLVRSQLRQALLNPDPKEVEEILKGAEQNNRNARVTFDKYAGEDGEHPAEEFKLIEQARELWKKWDSQLAELSRLIRLNTPQAREQASAVLNTENKVDREFIDALSGLIDFNKEEGDDSRKEASANFATVIILIGAFALSIVLIFGLVMLILTRSITRPISRLQRATTLIANGELGTRIAEVEATHDELGLLSQAFNQMAGRLDQSYQTSEKVSTEVLILTNQLNSTAVQQAASNQEQVASVNQVTSSLEELNETAVQIVDSARRVASSVQHSVALTGSVAHTSQTAYATANEGTQALEYSLKSVEQVRQRLEMMGQQLLTLTEHSRQVGAIVELIEALADETHLLALNASIEAAGGDSYIYHDATGPGVNGSRAGAGTASRSEVTMVQSVRGARFSVIAQEVKSLADRSREATREVGETLSQIQGAIGTTVLLAEETKKETANALNRSEIAGIVISKLIEAVKVNAGEVEQIAYAVREIEQRTEEIQLATNQQHSANQQILITMRGIAQSSRDSSSGISQLSQTASAVNDQMAALNRLISRPNLAVPAPS